MIFLKRKTVLKLALASTCLLQAVGSHATDDDVFSKMGFLGRGDCQGDINAPGPDSWQPKGKELEHFIEFQRQYSNSFFVKNRTLFVEILESSPQLHQAIRLALHFVGSLIMSSPGLDAEALNSRLLEAFVNKGNTRVDFHDRLEKFLINQLQALSQDINKERAGAFGRRAGAIIDRQIRSMWSEESPVSPVFSWTKNSSSQTNKINIPGEKRSETGLIILLPNSDLNQIAAQITSELEKPLLAFGRPVPDQLFFRLEKLSPKYVKLQRQYFALKEISKKAGIFDPFNPKEVQEAAEISDERKKQDANKRILSKLLNSSEFFQAYYRFADAYGQFGAALVSELDKGLFRSSELVFLNEVFKGKLVFMSMELVNMGVDFQTVSPRYKEVSRYIGLANSAIQSGLNNAIVVDLQ